MKILSIETSCDETGLALVEARGGIKAPRFTVLKNLVASQIKIHQPFGGVVPNIAKREHLKNLPVLYRELVGDNEAAFWKQISFITVTVGPGLEPALWTGVEFAKSLAAQFKKPLVGANHLEGHLYSFLLTAPTTRIFPAVALIVSGGHTILLRMESFTKWRRLGETRDDAVGEAFDKVARLLELPYPGGPEIEKLSTSGNAGAISFPRPMLRDKNFDFSFSGLKTAVLYYIRNEAHGRDPRRAISKSARTKKAASPAAPRANADIAASFQAAAIDVLTAKTIRAAQECGARAILLSGGVAANQALRGALARESKKIGAAFFVPDFKYNLDNAAMIAAAGYMAKLRGKKYKLAAKGDLTI